MKQLVLSFLISTLGVGALAASDDVLRPKARGQLEVILLGATAPKLRPEPELISPNPEVRPKLRPVSEQVIAFSSRSDQLAFLSPQSTTRPWLRPPELFERVMAKRRALRNGAVCGDIDIQGEEVGFVPGRIKACGIQGAVRVRSVAGVELSTQSLMNCRTADALKKWVKNGIQPAFNSRVSKLRVAAHYACRTRNNLPGAKISEHGKGNAIDISAIILQDGTEVTVLRGWNGKHSKALRQVHRKACGPFGTVLGPNADRFHRDHFHVDTARHRGGAYCR